MSQLSMDTPLNSPALSPARLPWWSLLALAMTGFICIITETIPAGLLPQISEGLHISKSMAGQLVTSYAIGSLIAAIPFAMFTGRLRRRPLLLAVIIGFAVFNTITALSSSYTLILAARFLAGVAAGAAWGMIAGYARRMVQDTLRGRALAIAMLGTPIALTFGVPAGTLLGDVIGWRSVFGIISLLSVVLIGWVIWKVPDYPGQQADNALSVRSVFTLPGIRPILLVVLAWMLAHNILYTYIAPFLALSGLEGRADTVLLVFGVAALASIWLTGILIDRHLRLLVQISLIGFILVAAAFWVAGTSQIVIFPGAAIWGLTFGGAATLLQTALANASGEEAVDTVMPLNTTVWNLAIALGGIVGGLAMEQFGAQIFPAALLILSLCALVVVSLARKYSFPAK